MTTLKPAVLHVLLALAAGDRHGYGIMQDVREQTDGAVRLGAGTLYGTLQRLIEQGYVREVPSPEPQNARDERRRHYRLTATGRRALDDEIEQLEKLVRLARSARRQLRGSEA